MTKFSFPQKCSDQTGVEMTREQYREWCMRMAAAFMIEALPDESLRECAESLAEMAEYHKPVTL